jgi:uncharacterized protein YjbI with pentapeptide repeats
MLSFSDFTDVLLDGAKLTGASATYLPSCPATLPSDWSCVRGNERVDSGGPFVLVGPGAALGSCPGGPYEADLSGADLAGLNLSGATLDFVDLSGADLADADLSGALLSAANLSGADLSGADLTDADLGPRTLEGEECSAQAWGADLTDAHLANVTWSNTICPDGTNSDDHGETCEGFSTLAP